MQNSSSHSNSRSSKTLTGHRRTHSSSDYDISRFSKTLQESPKTEKTPIETNILPPSEAHKKPVEDTPAKEYIIEPLDMTPEEQRILAGNAKYSKEHLNFGKNSKSSSSVFYNSFNQFFNPSHGNKETVGEKYKKQLEDQKISTILEKNDVLSNEDSSFNEIDRLSPINKNNEYIGRKEPEPERKQTFRRKKFHSNSHDLNIEKSLINCGQKSLGHSKNSPSQQVFTIYLKDPNRNEKQLDKIINFLKVSKKVPDVNLQVLQNKSLKNNCSSINFSASNGFQNFSMEKNEKNEKNMESTIKNLEKRVFLLENEVLDLKTENSKIRQKNGSLTKKLQEMGYLDSENMVQKNDFYLKKLRYLEDCLKKQEEQIKMMNKHFSLLSSNNETINNGNNNGDDYYFKDCNNSYKK